MNSWCFSQTDFMKIVTLAFMLLINITAMCQTKGDNKMFAASPATLHALKSILFENGYIATGEDSVFISTTVKELKEPVAIKMMFVRTDSGVYIKGLMKPTQSIQIGGVKNESEFEVVQYHGKNAMLAKWVKEPWKELEKIAKLISEKIIYSKN